MCNQSDKPKFVIFRSQSGIKVTASTTAVNPSNLICYCDHPQSAQRIAAEIAKHNDIFNFCLFT